MDSKLIVPTIKIELSYTDQVEGTNKMFSSEEFVEIIEVDENWVDQCVVDRAQTDNEVTGIRAADTYDEMVCFESEEQEDSSEEIDASSCVNQTCMSEDSDNHIELIEVGEDWDTQNFEDCEVDFHEENVEKIGDEINSDVCVRDKDYVAELRRSAKEVKGNSSFKKKESVRKRKTFKMPLKQRIAIKKQILQQGHMVRVSCNHGNCNIV